MESQLKWDMFLSYEQRMCEKGSGMTKEQLTGASIFHAWNATQEHAEFVRFAKIREGLNVGTNQERDVLLAVARAADKASAIAPGVCDEDVALEIALENAKRIPSLKAEIEKRG